MLLEDVLTFDVVGLCTRPYRFNEIRPRIVSRVISRSQGATPIRMRLFRYSKYDVDGFDSKFRAKKFVYNRQTKQAFLFYCSPFVFKQWGRIKIHTHLLFG